MRDYHVRLWRRADGLECVAWKAPAAQTGGARDVLGVGPRGRRWHLIVQWSARPVVRQERLRARLRWVDGRVVLTQRYRAFGEVWQAAQQARRDFHVTHVRSTK